MPIANKETIVLSNFLELYEPIVGEPDGWNRASAIPDYKPFFWPFEGSRTIWLHGLAPRFHSIFGELGFLDEDNTVVRKLEPGTSYNNLMSHVSIANKLLICSHTFSRRVGSLQDQLSRLGFEILDRCVATPEQISVWNTRVGGYELLCSVERVRPLLPETIVTFGFDQALRLVEMQPPGGLWYVKADFGVGGAGVFRLESGRPADIDLGTELAAFSNDIKARSLTRSEFIRQPFLVQKSVSPRETNGTTSLTADFQAYSDGSGRVCTRLLGAAEQILVGGTKYAGIRWAPTLMRPEQLDMVVEIGGAVGEAMIRHGYRGFFNVDFVIDRSEPILNVVEVNVRRSAPLDQFCFMAKAFGERWYLDLDFSFEFFEAAPLLSGWKALFNDSVTIDKLGRDLDILPVHEPAAESDSWPLYRFHRSPL